MSSSSSTDLDRYNGMYRQGHMFLTAAVTARGLRSASLVGCTFAQLGEYALELADGCRNVHIERCHIWDIGAGAMQLGVSDLATLLKPRAAANSDTGAAEMPLPDGDGAAVQEVLGLVIDNNCIHRLGTVWHGCYGIVNRFATCTIWACDTTPTPRASTSSARSIRTSTTTASTTTSPIRTSADSPVSTWTVFVPTGPVGPLLRFLADGRSLADGKQVLTAPPGTWTRVEIAFQLGEDAPGTYRLTLRHREETTRHTLPFRHDTFRDFRWLGFYGSDDIDGAFYLDDMKLSFDQ